MKDEYDRAREMEYKERQEKRKLLQKEPFKGTDHGNRTFAKDKQTFGKEGILPPVKYYFLFSYIYRDE
jgi:hypothetical protein